MSLSNQMVTRDLSSPKQDGFYFEIELMGQGGPKASRTLVSQLCFTLYFGCEARFQLGTSGSVHLVVVAREGRIATASFLDQDDRERNETGQ